jgi:hypothetical protein
MEGPCHCGDAALRKVTRKRESDHVGRDFFSCARYPRGHYDYFEWAGEWEDEEGLTFEPEAV